MDRELDKVARLTKQADEALDAKRFDEASALYSEVLALDARNIAGWINKGLAEWSLGRNEDALRSCETAIRIEPTNAVAWMNKGNALHGLNRRDEALECYDRALELDSRLARAWYNKGDELGHRGRVIEARACFENAYELGLPEAKEMLEQCERILMNDLYA